MSDLDHRYSQAKTSLTQELISKEIDSTRMAQCLDELYEVTDLICDVLNRRIKFRDLEIQRLMNRVVDENQKFETVLSTAKGDRA